MIILPHIINAILETNEIICKQDAYIHCKETADEQLERLMEEFVYPCDDSGVMKVLI